MSNSLLARERLARPSTSHQFQTVASAGFVSLWKSHFFVSIRGIPFLFAILNTSLNYIVGLAGLCTLNRRIFPRQLRGCSHKRKQLLGNGSWSRFFPHCSTSVTCTYPVFINMKDTFTPHGMLTELCNKTKS